MADLNKRQKIEVTWALFVYDVKQWFRSGMWFSIVRHLPDRIIYFATILAFSRAWKEAGTKLPDELTFEEVVKPWQPKP